MIIIVALIVGLMEIDSDSFCNSYGAIKKVNTVYTNSRCLVKTASKEVPLWHYILLKD